MIESLTPRVALVTAGGAGIGRTIAEAFLADGYTVHICDVAAEQVQLFLADNPAATGSVCDVSDPAQIEQMFQELKDSQGRLDVLVNNAGIAGPTAPVEQIDISDWQKTIAVDLNGPFYVTRLAVPFLEASGGGAIINIASTAALHGYPMRSAYAAAKWGLIGLTKTWAMELGPRNIRVNAICPGSVSGPRIDAVIEKDAQSRGVSANEVRDVYQRQTSMRLFVDPEDIANMAVYLGGPAGSKISGQSIAIDGHTEGLSNWLDD